MPKHNGKICLKHPALEGLRFKVSGVCVGCLRDYGKARRVADKVEVIRHYSLGRMCCARCKIIDMDVLTIDHIGQDGAAHRRINGIAGMSSRVRRGGKQFYKWLRQQKFPKGYRVLCFNCNIKAWLTHMRRGL